MSTTRTRLDPAVRREQILRHAVRIFRENSYSEVSLDQIANETGVTRGLLHHYFGSKRALYLEVLRTVLTVPSNVPIVPAGASGDLRGVLDTCVTSWMSMVQLVGGLWPGSAGAGIAESDIDAVVADARDVLVERMVHEVPFPAELDRSALRSALRAYASLSGSVINEWRTGETLTEAQARALLLETLVALVERVVPAVQAAKA